MQKIALEPSGETRAQTTFRKLKNFCKDFQKFTKNIQENFSLKQLHTEKYCL